MKISKLHTRLFVLLILGIGAASGFLFGSPENPLVTVGAVSAALILSCFIAGLASGDYSWVDRLWSVVPVGYGWVYAAYANFALPSLVVAALVTLWGARLSFNFARRGGYSGYEDYRWGVLRRRIHNPVLWQLFNFAFISFYQQALFVLFTLPLFVIYRASGQASGIREPGLFVGAAVALVGFLIFETVADGQQWNFQQEKYARAQTGGDTETDRTQTDGAARTARAQTGGAAWARSRKKEFSEEDLRRGFLTQGLFRYSRHPNYFGELGVWWMVYLTAVGVSGTWLHLSVIGPLLLTLLFLGSTRVTEAITSSKYEDYKMYRQNTSMILPLPSRGAPERSPSLSSSDGE